MLWVSAVSSAPLVSGVAPRRRASTARSRARSRWLSSSRSDSATSRATCALARCLPRATRRRHRSAPLAAGVSCSSLVDDRQRAGRERAGEEDRDGGEGAAEPAPGAGLAGEPLAHRPVLAVGDPLAGGDELVDVRRNLGLAGDELARPPPGGHRGRRRRRSALRASHARAAARSSRSRTRSARASSSHVASRGQARNTTSWTTSTTRSSRRTRRASTRASTAGASSSGTSSTCRRRRTHWPSSVMSTSRIITWRIASASPAVLERPVRRDVRRLRRCRRSPRSAPP